MCQADYLHDRNIWWLCVYRYQRSCCFHTPNCCHSGEVNVSKKAYVWQQGWTTRWQAAKLLLVRWISRYCARNLKPNGPAV